MNKLVILLVICLTLVGCKTNNNHIVKFTPVSIISDNDIGTISEHVMDMDIFDNKVLFGAYYWKEANTTPKLYAYNIGENNGIYTWHTFPGNYESIYTIFVRDNAVLNITTEQPVDHWAREKNSGWGLQKRMCDFGWGVLGDTLSNGESVRGYSTHKRTHPSIVEIFKDGFFKQLGNPVKGSDDSNRIVWCCEYFNGTYYIGTSFAEKGLYKSRECGNIYKLENDEWKPVYGSDTGKSIGGVLTCTVGDGRIFFGTYEPQKIIVFDGINWNEIFIDEHFDISKMWKDSTGKIFAGSYRTSVIEILQWDTVNKKFVKIYSTPSQGISFQSGVMGVCNRSTEMYIKYRNEDTKIKKLSYR